MGIMYTYMSSSESGFNSGASWAGSHSSKSLVLLINVRAGKQSDALGPRRAKRF
jgi:hypothetical protein